MAEEIVKILRVDTQESISSVKELKAAINDCKDKLVAMSMSMGDAAKDTEEYKEQVNQLQGYQHTLNDVMAVTKQKAEVVAGSYNDLNAQLVAARKEWKNMTKEQREADAAMGEGGVLGKIQGLDKQLKEMDAGMGQYQRNVGDYAGQIGSIAGLFGSAGTAAVGAATGVKTLGTSFKALLANPIVAVITAALAIVMKVIKAIKSSEESLQALTIALAPLKVVGDAVTKVFQGIGGALAKVAGWLGKTADKMGLVTEAMKQRQEIAKNEAQLLKNERTLLMESADIRLRIAELNAKSTEEDKYSAEERAHFLEEAAMLEEEVAQKTYENAKLAYETQKAKNALTQSSTEDLKEEAQLYADMVNAQAEYFNKTKELNSRRIAAVQQAAQVRSQQLTSEKELIDQEVALAKKGTEEQYNLLVIQSNKQYEINVASKKASIKDRKALHDTLLLMEKAHQEELRKLREQYQQDLIEENTRNLQNRMNIYEQGSEEYLKRAVNLRRYECDTLTQMDTESDEEFKARKQTAWKNLLKAQEDYVSYGLNQQRIGIENALNSFADGSLEYYRKAIELAQFDLDNLYQKAGESDAEYTARVIAGEKAVAKAREDYTNKQREEFDKQLSLYTGYAAGVSSILGSVADAIENSTDGSEAATNAVKNLRIASAIIETLSGAVTAYTQAQQLGPIAGPIMGSINAAAVVATGTAQIAKIRSTTVSTTSAATTSASTATAGVPTSSISSVPTSVTTTTASDETKLNQRIQSQKVYILSSDLEANSRRVQILSGETSF